MTESFGEEFVRIRGLSPTVDNTILYQLPECQLYRQKRSDEEIAGLQAEKDQIVKQNLENSKEIGKLGLELDHLHNSGFEDRDMECVKIRSRIMALESSIQMANRSLIPNIDSQLKIFENIRLDATRSLLRLEARGVKSKWAIY